MIAFAGHGVQLKADNRMYFCPLDVNLDKVVTLISLDEIYAMMEKDCKAGVKLLLVDACRNDPLDGRSVKDAKLSSVTRPQIPDPPGGMAAFFSCSKGQKAFESDTLKHGVFFNYLIEGLSGKASNSEGEVTIPTLEDYLTRQVSKTVKLEQNNPDIKQIPERRGTLRGAVVLIKVVPEKIATPAVEAPKPQPAKAPPAPMIDLQKPSVRAKVPGSEQFVSLFNGKDLSGWMIEGGPAQWQVQGSEIVANSANGKPRSYLLTEKSISDFILRFEFNIASDSNGAIAIRAVPGELMPQPKMIFDHPIIKLVAPDAKMAKNGQRTGTSHWVRSLDKNQQPANVPLASGMWHSMEVTVRDRACVVIADGQKLVDMKAETGRLLLVYFLDLSGLMAGSAFKSIQVLFACAISKSWN